MRSEYSAAAYFHKELFDEIRKPITVAITRGKKSKSNPVGNDSWLDTAPRQHCQRKSSREDGRAPGH